jgi:hypothetical protein
MISIIVMLVKRSEDSQNFVLEIGPSGKNCKFVIVRRIQIEIIIQYQLLSIISDCYVVSYS